MAKIKRRKKNKLLYKSRANTPKKRKDIQGTIVNSAIVVLSLLVVAFIFSFSNRQIQTGVPIEVTFPAIQDTPKLAMEIYEQNPILDIEVEVLNGCGIPGLAGKVSDFLRTKHLDVVRAENADHYNYDQTLVILRNENVDGLQKIANLFSMDEKSDARVKHIPNDQLDVDITVILGKDISQIKPFSEVIQ
ncbi:MAG: LytR C-terminal domain-containing protein [Fidelibacterota bacterium]